MGVAKGSLAKDRREGQLAFARVSFRQKEFRRRYLKT
jgi:hypothetical protein